MEAEADLLLPFLPACLPVAIIASRPALPPPRQSHPAAQPYPLLLPPFEASLSLSSCLVAGSAGAVP